MSNDKKIKKMLEEQDEIATKFYNAADFMVKKYIKQAPSIMKIFLKILQVYQTFNPHFCIKSSGPFFFKHREDINNNNINWAKECDFERQMEDWRELINKAPAGFGKGMIDGKIDEIRDFIKTIIEKVDPQKGIEISQTFLKWYCDYAILLKDIEDLENSSDDENSKSKK